MCSEIVDLTQFDGTMLAQEQARIDAGESWCVAPVAGLQFYSYGTTDDLVGRVLPEPGDSIGLMRRPDNSADSRAIEVWWRNRFHLGHLPRDLAWDLAALMDEGRSARAYVYDTGNGSAWSMRLIVVGAAVRPVHTRRLKIAVAEAVEAATLATWPVRLPDWTEVPESERRGRWIVRSEERMPPTDRQRDAASAWSAGHQAVADLRRTDALQAFPAEIFT